MGTSKNKFLKHLSLQIEDVEKASKEIAGDFERTIGAL